jgi:predicted secreted Zn-dependent protease
MRSSLVSCAIVISAVLAPSVAKADDRAIAEQAFQRDAS